MPPAPTADDDDDDLPPAAPDLDPRWLNAAPTATLRIDKWLWHARFFRSRALATDAVAKGRVELNGERVKASRSVKPGDRLAVSRGPDTVSGLVQAIPVRRGPASLMAGAFAEDAASQARRAAEVERRRKFGGASPAPDTRPTKQQRRQLARMHWQVPDEGGGDDGPWQGQEDLGGNDAEWSDEDPLS